MGQIVRDIFLYFSAFIPMYFLIQIKFLADLAFDNVEANSFVVCVLCFLALLIVLGIIGLLWSIRWNPGKTERIVIKQATNITDQHFLGYLSIFILFALGFDLSRVSMSAVFIFITIFVGKVYLYNKLFYINPFLNILGFNFFEIKYVKEGEERERTAKIFYRGRLEASDEIRKVRLKNEQLSFIDKTESN